jgi:hypothetical protein
MTHSFFTVILHVYATSYGQPLGHQASKPKFHELLYCTSIGFEFHVIYICNLISVKCFKKYIYSIPYQLFFL